MVAYSYKKRFVNPIRVGLGIQVHHEPGGAHVYRPKRQTIRADRKRHARPGEELQHYCGMRTKGCFLIGRARCTAVHKVELWLGTGDQLGVSIDGNYFCGSTAIREFAQADGFEDAAAMVTFWRENHPDVNRFEGVLIRWEPPLK